MDRIICLMIGINIMTNDSFGEFIVNKRKKNKLTARQLALKLNISSNYLCEIEKGKKIFVSDEILENMKKILCDNLDEELLFYELIALEQNTIPKDISQYVLKNKYIQKAIRLAQKLNVAEQEWEVFITYFSDKYNK